MATAVREELSQAVAWAPQSAPQEALLRCPVEDVFYGGARGGGKTDALLGDFAAHAGQYGAKAKGILFRRTYPELEQVEARAKEVFDLLGWSHNETKHNFTAPNGATLKLRYLLRDKDAEGYQGHSYTWQGWDELTNWASSVALDKLWATLRSADGVPCFRRSTGNPGGPGHGWVKARYIDPAPIGYEVFQQRPNPKFPELAIETVFIPSNLDDNPLIASAGYEARIAAATGTNDALWEAWRYGNWDVFVGQAYSEFSDEFHIIRGKGPEDFGPATEWFASMDWGYSRGTYGLHAVDREGRVELVWEFYKDFSGLHAEAAAAAILEQSKHWPRPRFIHADEQMWYEVGQKMTIAEEFELALHRLMPTNTPGMIKAKHGPRSRSVKVSLIHQWLAPGTVEGTRLPARGANGKLLPWAVPDYRVHARCENTIRVLKEIPVDPDNPEDVDPEYADDHPHDMVGFAVTSRAPRPKVPKEPPHKIANRAHQLVIKDGKLIKPEPSPKTVEELVQWAERRSTRKGARVPQFTQRVPRR